MSHKAPKDRGSHSRHLWVGSFQNKVAAKDVAQYFERFGPLENISVKDNYAFVNYRKISSAVKALEVLNGSEVLGSKVAVKFTEGVPTRMLWIGSLPAAVTEQELKEKFQRFGNSFIGARIFRKTNSATIHYGKLDDAKLAYKQSKNMELRGQPIKLDYGMRTKPVGRGNSRGRRGGPPGGAPRGRGKPHNNEPERGKPKVRREHREEGESDEEYHYRAEEGLDPNLRFTITIPNNDPPYDQQPPPEADMNMNMNIQEQVDPQLLQQVVQSLLNSSGMPMDQSQVAGMMPDGVNGALPSLDPTFLAQLQDTISQAGLFNTANNLNALVSNTAMPDVSRFFPVEDNNRGRFYPTDEPNDRREEHRHGRDEDYYYDRERLIDRNLSRFYNNERDRNHSRDSHRNEPRGSSPPRPEPRGSTPPRDSHRTRSRSPSRRSRTPPRDAIQLSEEDLLVQARKAVEAGRKDRAEESRGQKRSSPDNISDRPEKRQKTSTDSTPPKTPTTTDKNKSTNSSESTKSDSLHKSTSKSGGPNVTITVTANGPVDSTSATTTIAPSTTSSNTNASSSKKSNEVPKTSSTSTSSAQTSATKSAASSAGSTTAKTTSKTSSPNTAKATAPSNSTTSSSSKPTNGTAVSSNDTGVRMEVDSRSGSAPSVASSTNGSNSGTAANTTGGSGGAKNGSTTVGTSGTTAVSGSAVITTTTTGSSGSPSVQGGGSVASTGGSVTSGQTNGAAPASNPKAPSSAAPSGAPKAPMAGKSTTAAPTAPKPVVFVPVKPEPVRNNTNAATQQQVVAPTAVASTVPQASATSTQPSTTPTVVQGPSTSQSVQKPTSVQPVQSTAQPTAASLLGVPASDKSSPVTTSVSAPQTPLVSNTNQLPPTSNPLAPPGLPSPVSSAPKSIALGFIKNMLEDNPVIPQPPSSPISPPRSPKRIDKPQVWHGYLAKRGTIVCDMVAYFLGGSELWRKLSPMLDLKERTNLTNLTNFFPTDNTIKPSLLYLQPASKGETFKYASIHRYLKNIEKAGICLGEEEIYRIYVLPMTREEAMEFNIDDDMPLFALIVPRPKSLRN